MALKEILIGKQSGIEIKPKFTYSLFEENDFLELSRKNQDPAYIFISLLKQKDRRIVAFGISRTHEDLRDAVRRDIGEFEHLGSAQIYIKDEKITSLRFNYLPDYNNEREQNTKFIFDNINPKFFPQSPLFVRYGRGEEAIYDPASKDLVML